MAGEEDPGLRAGAAGARQHRVHSPGQVGRVGNVAALEPAADFFEDALLARLVSDVKLRVGRGDEREHEVGESATARELFVGTRHDLSLER